MYKRILLLGDSQTQRGAVPHGWVNLLANQYCRQLDITNRGLSGYNTRWTVERLRDIVPAVPAYHYDLAVVWFGCNDAVVKGVTAQHVPQQEYSRNLTQIVWKLVECVGIQPNNLLVLTPPCVDEVMLKEAFPDSRTNEIMREYADLALIVARDRGCESADLFSLFSKHAPEGLFTDGLHLSKRGHELVAEVVTRFLSHRVAETLPIPDWKDCNES
ncbi:isoamyl acetate-hydrolyzing esterase 1 homolog [Bolinopsis microptera]|uniref:isoamyl acetate-hydrolyzing esterase 1 homolog n=1 Tax=Bolinopsis microptera TaxID=2820187 RepID=UPI003078CAAC